MQRVRLNTLTNSRHSFARVIREYVAGKLEESEARTLAYLFSRYLEYWKVEQGLELERRLDELERKLGGVE